jgi:hypothetical protein
MNVRCIPILQLGRLSVRCFHLTTTRLAIMEGGVTGQELEEALKTRLSAVHSQIKDISGKSSLFRRKLTIRGMWTVL